MVHGDCTVATQKNILGKMYKQNPIYLITLLLLMTGFISCGTSKEDPNAETRDRGTIHISADESFKPVIDSQIKVFESAYPEAKVIATYKPESECLKDLYNDSVRMVIVTRKLDEGEKNLIADSFKVYPDQMIIARDAVAVIVNPSAPDSLFTMNDIRNILTGKFKKNLIPVFDNTRATSTVRFIIDSVLRGDSLTPKTRAAQTSQEVINYVAETKDAVGFIGVSWIGNQDDPQQLSFLKKVKIAQLESLDVPGSYIYPVQANIYAMRYPMIRDLVYILKEKKDGVGKTFASFMSGERGQLIFQRAYLLPAQKNFYIRPVSAE